MLTREFRIREVYEAAQFLLRGQYETARFLPCRPQAVTVEGLGPALSVKHCSRRTGSSCTSVLKLISVRFCFPLDESTKNKIIHIYIFIKKNKNKKKVLYSFFFCQDDFKHKGRFRKTKTPSKLLLVLLIFLCTR